VHEGTKQGVQLKKVFARSTAVTERTSRRDDWMHQGDVTTDCTLPSCSRTFDDGAPQTKGASLPDPSSPIP